MCEAWAWPLGARLRHLDSMTAGVTPLGQTRRLFSSRPSQPETAGTTQAAGPRGRKPQARGGHGEEARTEVIESTARFIAKNQSLPTPWSPSASEQPPGVPEPPATATGSCPENAPEPLSPGPSLSRPAPGLPPSRPPACHTCQMGTRDVGPGRCPISSRLPCARPALRAASCPPGTWTRVPTGCALASPSSQNPPARPVPAQSPAPALLPLLWALPEWVADRATGQPRPPCSRGGLRAHTEPITTHHHHTLHGRLLTASSLRGAASFTVRPTDPRAAGGLILRVATPLRCPQLGPTPNGSFSVPHR